MIFGSNAVLCFHFCSGLSDSKTGKRYGVLSGWTRITNVLSKCGPSKTCLVLSKKWTSLYSLKTEKIKMRILNGLVILIFLADFMRPRLSFRDVSCGSNRSEVRWTLTTIERAFDFPFVWQVDNVENQKGCKEFSRKFLNFWKRDGNWPIKPNGIAKFLYVFLFANLNLRKSYVWKW